MQPFAWETSCFANTSVLEEQFVDPIRICV